MTRCDRQRLRRVRREWRDLASRKLCNKDRSPLPCRKTHHRVVARRGSNFCEVHGSLVRVCQRPEPVEPLGFADRLTWNLSLF